MHDGASAQSVYQPVQGDLLSPTTNGIPGRVWFETNLADQGLGWSGTYFTIGGKTRLFEDRFDGRWLLESQIHYNVSEGGGAFANIGVERVFSIPAAEADVSFGLWYDYNGDRKEDFSHTFHQVGISGKIKKEKWDLLVNGYLPTGVQDYSYGDPLGLDCFVGNEIVIIPGIDSALSGFDVTLRTRPRQLAGVNGFLDIGGYGYNSDLIDSFGGGKIRLGFQGTRGMMVNLEVNQDDRFNTTGVVGLGWVFGQNAGGRGSEYAGLGRDLETSVRNDHIVVFNQDVVLAMDPTTGAAYNVIHVDNTAAAGGNGTAEAPFTNLADAQTAAQQAWDIVYVHEGNSRVAPNFYSDPFAFQAENQFLVGSGGPLTIEVGSQCGTFNPASGAFLYTIPAQSTNNPLLSNPGATSIDTNGQGGLTIANLDIVGSQEALLVQGGDLNGTAQPFGTTANPYNSAISLAGGTSVRNVNIGGDGTAAIQRGVRITNSTGGIEFTDTTIANMTRSGLLIDNNTGALNVSYDGRIVSDTVNTGGIASPLVVIDSNTGAGTFDIAVGSPPAGSLITTNELSDTGGEGIIISNNADTVTNNLGNISLTDTVLRGIYVFDDASTTRISSDGGLGIVRNTAAGAAIEVSDDGAGPITAAPVFTYFGTIDNTASSSYLLLATGSNEDAGRGSITLSGPTATPFTDTGLGILLQNVDATVSVSGASLASTGQNAILATGGSGAFAFNDISVTGGTTAGILITDRAAAGDTTTFSNLTINNPNLLAHGISAANGGTITIGGVSSIETASTTFSTIHTFDNLSGDTTLSFTLQTVTTPNANVTPWTNPPFGAISLAASSGFIDIQSAFDVNGAAGTGVNVENNSTVTVDVNGLQISP